MLNTKFYIYLIEKYAKNAVNIHLYMYNSYKIEIMSVEKKLETLYPDKCGGFIV